MRHALVLLLLTACDPAASSGTPAPTGTDPASQEACTTDQWWNRGASGSSRMHPGVACIDCHQRRGAPRFTVAGTVYTGSAEPDDCYGTEGVTVEIIDANDDVHPLTTNAAGNFHLRSSDIAFPIRARVVDGDTVREMLTPQASGDCNSCHTMGGASGAAGRIVLP